MKVFFAALCIAILISCALSQPPGWRMVDRFYGFRYELSGPTVVGTGVELFAVHHADELGRFGWIQKSPRNTLVGEARCSKQQGPVFEERLRSKAEKMTVLVILK